MCFSLCLSAFSLFVVFCVSSRRRHTRCALVTGVQTCALPIFNKNGLVAKPIPIRAKAKMKKETSNGIRLSNRETSHPEIGKPMSDPMGMVNNILPRSEIGREACRESVCQYVEISLAAVSLRKKNMHRAEVSGVYIEQCN